mgnify:FL=1
MSIEVRIPKEITDYKEKILFGLTIRQLLCFICAVILGLVSYFIVSKFLGTQAAGYVVIIEVLPIFALGFFKKNGFTFEKYLKLILKHKLGQNKRKYQTELNIQHKKEDIRNAEKSTSKKKANNTEQLYFAIPGADHKRKLQSARQSIANATKEFNTKNKEHKKATKNSLKRTADNQV